MKSICMDLKHKVIRERVAGEGFGKISISNTVWDI